MKRNAIMRIVLFSVGIVVLIGLLIEGFALRYAVTELGDFTEFIFNSKPIDNPGDLTMVADYAPSKVTDLKIDWVSGNIDISAVDTADRIYIHETEALHEECPMKLRLIGTTLVIEFDQKDHHFGITSTNSKTLRIVVPKDWNCNTLEIDTASANVVLQDLQLEELDFDGASGTCSIYHCDIGELDMDTASGDITFLGTLNILDFDGASANCRISVTNIPQMIKIDTASGDLDLTLPDDCGYSCDMEVLSGSYWSEFETTYNGSHTHGDGSCRIEVNAMSGNVSIHKLGGSAAMITEPPAADAQK